MKSTKPTILVKLTFVGFFALSLGIFLIYRSNMWAYFVIAIESKRLNDLAEQEMWESFLADSIPEQSFYPRLPLQHGAKCCVAFSYIAHLDSLRTFSDFSICVDEQMEKFIKEIGSQKVTFNKRLNSDILIVKLDSNTRLIKIQPCFD